jgi:hypothetical protein
MKVQWIERLSGGNSPMKPHREVKNACAGGLNVKFVGIAAPTPHQFNFIVGKPCIGGRRSCNPSEGMTCKGGRIETSGMEEGFERRHKERILEGGSIIIAK